MNEEKTTPKITSKDINYSGYKTLFSGDKYLMYIHKKSHSISRAIYLITDFFDEKEPIKIKMRQIASDLIDQVLTLSTELSPGRKILLDDIIKSCLSLISHSEIAMFSAIESQMNHSIVTSEIENLMSVIEEREVSSRLGRHFVLDHSLFIKDSHTIDKTTGHKLSEDRSTDRPVLSHFDRHTHTGSTNISTGFGSHNSENTQHYRAHVTHSNDSKNQRRQAILSVIQAKGHSSIKDIADVVKNCSEKTIQRELLDMVDAKVLKKEGERRWTRYSLVV